MNSRKQRGHVMDLLFTLGLFAIFAIMALLVVAIGVNVYRNTTARMGNNYTTRTSLAYITEKMHQYDTSDSITLDEIEGQPAISMTETMQGESYTTYIYFYEGNICELLIRSDRDPACRQGTPVMEAQDLEITEMEDGIFCLTVTDTSGKETQTFVNPVSEKE